ncbi:hypothetical protein SDC9_188717 [bioreactor metagenome]|uniref:DUF5655 domain-containing protein n=1 Tax=bioreactor metagenome TaxID=1076179 RepID=A0A645HQ41_9ZZZZ|nr:hypothetical protein [Oscillospiraceae bacterium]
MNDYISETMNDKIKTALGGTGGSVSAPEQASEAPIPQTEDKAPEKAAPNIVTTEEELEAYFIIKNLLKDITDIHDITYKDTESYINILYKGNTWKWICRLRITPNQKLLIIPDENKKDIKYKLSDIYDLTQHSDEFHAVLQRYL